MQFLKFSGAQGRLIVTVKIHALVSTALTEEFGDTSSLHSSSHVVFTFIVFTLNLFNFVFKSFSWEKSSLHTVNLLENLEHVTKFKDANSRTHFLFENYLAG